jgi:hypothetical protein
MENCAMKNGLIKKVFVCSLIMVGMSICAEHSLAQELFSGAGIRSNTPSKKEAKSRWPKLMDFSKAQPAKEKPFQPFSSFTTKKAEAPEPPPAKGMFSLPTFNKPSFNKPSFSKPSFNWMKKKPRPTGRPDLGFGALSNSNQAASNPNFLSQMNAKSKGFIDRTTGWAQRKNQNLREKSSETWDSITQDLRDYQRENPPSATTPAMPPVRTAEAPSQSRIRF